MLFVKLSRCPPPVIHPLLRCLVEQIGFCATRGFHFFRKWECSCDKFDPLVNYIPQCPFGKCIITKHLSLIELSRNNLLFTIQISSQSIWLHFFNFYVDGKFRPIELILESTARTFSLHYICTGAIYTGASCVSSYRVQRI